MRLFVSRTVYEKRLRVGSVKEDELFLLSFFSIGNLLVCDPKLMLAVTKQNIPSDITTRPK